jgi:SAM-dependent methyltransferase
MKGYRPETYGDHVADVYDEWSESTAQTQTSEAAAEFLAALSPRGRAVELGIGTGRVALALSARGLEVHGVEISERMVEQLWAKPGRGDLEVVVGDFADVPVSGQFDLVYVVFNTLYALTTQDEQVRCVANVAARLGPGGKFVVEAFVPDVARFDRGQRVQVNRMNVGEVHVDLARHYPVSQTTSSQQLVITPTGLRFYPMRLRYIWPSELDLMCQLAGLRLIERFGGWEREPFTAASTAHVSVYTKAGQRP